MKCLTPIPFMLLCGMFLSCGKSPTKSEERPQVIVTEDITEDTVWESGKDYIVCGEVAIIKNIGLTIEPDVDVYLQDVNETASKLIVEGGILAHGGEAGRMIRFLSSGLAGNAIEIFEATRKAVFNFCSFQSFNYGLKINSSNFNVLNTEFIECGSGCLLFKCAKGCVRNSVFRDCGVGIKIEQSSGEADSSLQVTGSEFLNCTNAGIEITNISKVFLINNSFRGCKKGAAITHGSAANIKNNCFDGCEVGCYYFYRGVGVFEKNIVRYCDSGVQVVYVSRPNINYNNIYDCNKYIVELGYPIYQSIDARNNWWGVHAAEGISEKIFDGNDMSREGMSFVEFIPYEMNEIAGCGIGN